MSEPFKILFVADVVGEPGRKAVAEILPRLKEEHAPDLTVLNGENSGPINNLCVPSEVNPSYAPAGQSLVSVTTLGDGAGVEAQLAEWYGPVVSTWRHLRTLHIPYALPPQLSLEPVEKPPKVNDRLYVCGDHMDVASIQGAMVSGRRAAEAILTS